MSHAPFQELFTQIHTLRQAQIQDIQEIRPAQTDQKIRYEQLLDRFAKARGGPLFFPYISSGRGNGSLVELLDGSIKYDWIGGIGPHYLGHCHPKMLEAMLQSALEDTVMQGHLQQGLPPLILMEKLLEMSQLDHCFLSSSGAMATENGLKLAFHKKQHATRVLAFEGCFMGRTLTLSQITDKPTFRTGFPTTLHVDHIPFTPHNPQYSLERLNQCLARHPQQYGAMCFELIQGEGGIRVGNHSFFQQLMRVCKTHKIPIVIDEVQTFGRTYQPFAFQHFELEEWVDIVCIGKVSMCCATLFKNEWKPSPGILSQTFTASTSAIYATLALLEELSHGHYYGPEGKIAQFFTSFSSKLEALGQKHPGILQGPFGLGGMIAFTPFDGSATHAMELSRTLFEEGLITFIAGQNPTRIRMLPPIPALKDIEAESNRVIDVIEKSLVKVKFK